MTKLEAIEAGHIRMKIKNLTAEYRLAEQGKSNFCTVELEVIIDKLRQRLELLML